MKKKKRKKETLYNPKPVGHFPTFFSIKKGLHFACRFICLEYNFDYGSRERCTNIS